MTFSPVVAGLWRLQEWQLDTPALVRWIEQVLALGITSFDHADIYGGYSVEAAFGQALAVAPALRQRMQIVSKCGIQLVHPSRPQHKVHGYDSSAAHVRASVEQSLCNLNTDHLDVLLLHRPDLLMDPDELAATLADLRQQGKVLAFGVSNHNPSQFALLHRRLPLVTNQIELSPLQMAALADGTLDQAVDLGLRPMIWSPLARGRLFTGTGEQEQRVRAVLQALADDYGVTPATVAYAWTLRHPSRPLPITGSGRIQALQEAMLALSLRLSTADWYRVWQASMGHEVP